MEKKKIRLEEILPVIEEKLASGGTVEIPITGTSMLPLLVQGRDTVVLKKAKGNLKKYDLPLYRRKDGAFVLHRIVSAENDSFSMCGDNQWIIEKGIGPSQIIGVVSVIKRKGKIIDVNSAGYRFYCRVWKLLFPVRKYIVKARGRLYK